MWFRNSLFSTAFLHIPGASDYNLEALTRLQPWIVFKYVWSQSRHWRTYSFVRFEWPGAGYIAQILTLRATSRWLLTISTKAETFSLVFDELVISIAPHVMLLTSTNMWIFLSVSIMLLYDGNPQPTIPWLSIVNYWSQHHRQTLKIMVQCEMVTAECREGNNFLRDDNAGTAISEDKVPEHQHRLRSQL